MCGVLGTLGNTSAFPMNVFEAALNSLAHRGPDASLIWSDPNALLGHRRLAIIDLSDSGIQPFQDKDSGYWIVFNGEIYNYIELKKQLESLGHRFQTQTDTEVLLKGYAEWGENVQHKCNGMWSFLIWDPNKQKAFFSRDRFGVKPFYFAKSRGGFLFASEPKALHVLDQKLTEIDPNAIVELVVNSRIHVGAQTAYKNIDALPAAHCGTYDVAKQECNIWRYWDYPEADTDGDKSTNYEEFDEIFSDAVKIRLRSDVDVGLTLSGGLDSSAVLCGARNSDSTGLKCFTSVYSGAEGGELSWAQKAARLAGSELLPVESDLETWWDTLKLVVHHMDAPGFSPAVLPLWSIMKEARATNIPVLLEGQGADELLAGYHWHSAVNVLDDIRSLRVGNVVTNGSEMLRAYGFKWSMAWFLRMAFSGPYETLIKSRRHSVFKNELIEQWKTQQGLLALPQPKQSYDALKRSLHKDHSTVILPALLHYGDSISMAHGIESRLPFMDYRLVEWVFKSNIELQKDGKSKSPVRSFLLNNNFSEIAERRDKVGYNTPLESWFEQHCSWQIKELISNKNAPVWEIMSRSRVQKITERLGNGLMQECDMLYRILTTSIWMDELKVRSGSSAG